jgi:hypothetical protein
LENSSVFFREENVPTVSFKGQLSFGGVEFQDYAPGFQLEFILRDGFEWESGLSSRLYQKRRRVSCDR